MSPFLNRKWPFLSESPNPVRDSFEPKQIIQIFLRNCHHGGTGLCFPCSVSLEWSAAFWFQCISQHWQKASHCGLRKRVSILENCLVSVHGAKRFSMRGKTRDTHRLECVVSFHLADWHVYSLVVCHIPGLPMEMNLNASAKHSLLKQNCSPMPREVLEE